MTDLPGLKHFNSLDIAQLGHADAVTNGGVVGSVAPFPGRRVQTAVEQPLKFFARIALGEPVKFEGRRDEIRSCNLVEGTGRASKVFTGLLPAQASCDVAKEVRVLVDIKVEAIAVFWRDAITGRERSLDCIYPVPP